MGKPRMMGAFAPYTPNSKMDMRYNHKAYEQQKRIAENATLKAEKRQKQGKDWR